MDRDQPDRVDLDGQTTAATLYEAIQSSYLFAIRLRSGEKIDLVREAAALAAAEDLGTP